ncbi:MAG: hypothetical protein IKO72_03485 [Kiritimatiellae bacterium]|nr:hypothetical protein [Kiritimatiellia bacterium]
MKMNLQRFGRKFFFITLATEGRVEVLSRINPDAMVALLPAGEAVAAAWRETHRRNPALTASNFIIMPDHIHLLLIANYDIDPNFDVIGWIKDFQRRSEWMAGNDTRASPRAPKEASPRAPKEASPRAPKAGFGAVAPFHWERRFWLVLSFSSRQLKAIRRYIKLNPARALWKAQHPNRFMRRTNIRHPILDASRQWDAIGNPLLLSSPFLFHVRLTRKLSLEEHRPAIDEIIEKARHGMIPISGFISPGEKEALRRLKEEPLARFIKMRPCALPPKYDPSAEDSRELAADRMLILSGFPQSVVDAGAIFRANCLAMNEMAAMICERASQANA